MDTLPEELVEKIFAIFTPSFRCQLPAAADAATLYCVPRL
jgi:hypothetical protein